VVAASIPTTLEGPSQPVTRRFDPSLRQGSDDVPLSDLRLAKKVKAPFPEQIAIAASFSPSSLWVSWVTGTSSFLGKELASCRTNCS
jgi:acid phosphatase type 7